LWNRKTTFRLKFWFWALLIWEKSLIPSFQLTLYSMITIGYERGIKLIHRSTQDWDQSLIPLIHWSTQVWDQSLIPLIHRSTQVWDQSLIPLIHRSTMDWDQSLIPGLTAQPDFCTTCSNCLKVSLVLQMNRSFFVYKEDKLLSAKKKF